MIQHTIATLVQAPTETRQALYVTIFMWLQRRCKPEQRYFDIGEVNTAVTLKAR